MKWLQFPTTSCSAHQPWLSAAMKTGRQPSGNGSNVLQLGRTRLETQEA